MAAITRNHKNDCHCSTIKDRLETKVKRHAKLDLAYTKLDLTHVKLDLTHANLNLTYTKLN